MLNIRVFGLDAKCYEVHVIVSGCVSFVRFLSDERMNECNVVAPQIRNVGVHLYLCAHNEETRYGSN